jgi:hypothetical protein
MTAKGALVSFRASAILCGFLVALAAVVSVAIAYARESGYESCPGGTYFVQAAKSDGSLE